jgi:hypothetical protein
MAKLALFGTTGYSGRLLQIVGKTEALRADQRQKSWLKTEVTCFLFLMLF